MNKKIGWGIAVVVVVIVIYFVGVNRNAPVSVGNGEPIKIGVMTDLSSSAAGVYGIPLQRGIDLALAEINRGQKKYEAIYEDYQLDSKQVLLAYNSLKAKGAHLFIVDGSPALSILDPEIKKDGNLIMNPASFIPLAKDEHPLLCRISVTVDTYGPAYANLAVNKLNKKNVALLLPDYNAGVALRDGITMAVTNAGGKIVDTEMYLKDATDFRTQLTKLKANKQVDVLITVNYFKSVQTMFQEIKELGLKTQIITDDWTIANTALVDRSLANGTYFVGYSYSGDNPKTDLAKKFYANFRAAYQADPGLESVQGYDLIGLFDLGITQTGTTSPRALADYFAGNVKDYPGVGGLITFNSACEVTRDIAIRNVVDGKLVDVDK